VCASRRVSAIETVWEIEDRASMVSINKNNIEKYIPILMRKYLAELYIGERHLGTRAQPSPRHQQKRIVIYVLNLVVSTSSPGVGINPRIPTYSVALVFV